MKRTIVLLGTMFLAAAIGQEKTAPIDPGGWNKAKWGMNQSQISDVFPEAKPYEVPGIERGSKRLLPKGDVVGQVQFIHRILGYDPSTHHGRARNSLPEASRGRGTEFDTAYFWSGD